MVVIHYHIEQNILTMKTLIIWREPSSYTDVTTFPLYVKNRRTLEQNMNILPIKIKTIYEVAIKALSNSCYLLTAVAFRTIIEAICIDKKIDWKDLNQKIDKLVSQRLITQNEGD